MPNIGSVVETGGGRQPRTGAGRSCLLIKKSHNGTNESRDGLNILDINLRFGEDFMAKKMVKLVVLLIVVISFISIAYAQSTTVEDAQNNLAPLPFWTVIGYCYVGVLISFILPILIGYAKLIKDPAIQGQGIEPYWKILRPYLAIALASLCITFIVIAYSLSQGADFYQWFIPFLGGYTFDATLQKLK